MNFTEPVLAALIGATATVVTALVQLRIAAKKQAVERMAGRPAPKGNRWLAILALMLASAVAGYAFSEYRGFASREDDRVLRDEMHSRLKDIGAMAVRLEKANLQTNPQVDADARLAVERKRGMDGVAAIVQVPACKPSLAGSDAASSACTEADASRTAVCAVIPVSATVMDVQLFLRADVASGSWAAARIDAGADAGGARFVDSWFERAAEADSKEICMSLAHWAADKGRGARILVRYTL